MESRSEKQIKLIHILKSMVRTFFMIWITLTPCIASIIKSSIVNGMIIDSCHEKIDLFRFHNWVIHEHAWWKGSRVYQPVKLFSEWLTNFLLIWHQIYHSGSNRTDFMAVLRPRNSQNFEPGRGLFSQLWPRYAFSIIFWNYLRCLKQLCIVYSCCLSWCTKIAASKIKAMQICLMTF